MSIQWKNGGVLAIAVTNLEESIEWYCDVFAGVVTEDLRQMGWCEVSAPVQGLQFGLQQVEKFLGAEGGATPMFEVSDIEAARKTLEAKSVKFEGQTMTIPNIVSMATFFDPSGNALKIYQNLSS